MIPPTRIRLPQTGLLFLITLLGTGPGSPAAIPGPETNSAAFHRAAWYRAERGLTSGVDAARAQLSAWRQLTLQPHLAVDTAPGVAWVPIGPRPLLSSPTGPATAYTGRIGDIAVDPADSNHWLVGGAQGGIWETRDAGETWQPRTDDQPSLAYGAIAFAPSQPLVVYAGTGEAVFSGDAVSGAGVLKSIDGGQSWQHLPSSAGPFAGTTFSELTVDPNNPAVVLAATGRGVFATTDGGVNWSARLAGVATDLEVDPTDFSHHYAAIGSVYGASENGVYRSLNGGANWERVPGPWELQPGGLGRIEVAIAPSSPGIVYVSIQDRLGDGEAADGDLLGVWRTSDAWSASPGWTRLPAPPAGDNLWYNHDLSVAPRDSSTLFLAHLQLHRFDGTSWMAVNGPMHVDMQSLAWAGNRLIVGNDGGVWSTEDSGASYLNHNAGLELIQFYRGAVHAPSGSVIIGGSQDNGTGVWRGTNTWRQFGPGDGAGCAIAAGNSNHWAFSSQFLGIRRTRNGGVSTELASAGIEPGNRPFIGRLVKAPHRDDVFVTATHRVFRCTNFFTATAVVWQTNSPDFGAAVHALAFAPSDPRALTFAAGLADGGVRRTTNGGLTWRNADPTAQLPARPVRDLRFHPLYSNVVYLAIGGVDPTLPRCVFKTTNFGSPSPSWQNLSPPVNLGANTLVLDPTRPDTVWVGTDLAAWRSRDGGTNWTRFGPETGLPNVGVDQLEIDAQGRLTAFTHGRGAFQLVPSADADLAVHQSVARDPAPVGCPLTISVVVSNRGPTAATNIILLDRLPAGRLEGHDSSSFESATFTNGRFNFRRARLEVGQIAALTVRVTPTNTAPLTNFIAVVAGSPDPNPGNNANSRVLQAVTDARPPTLLGVVPGPVAGGFEMIFDEPVEPGNAIAPAWVTVIDGLGDSETVRAEPVFGDPSRLQVFHRWTGGPGPLAVTVVGVTDCAGNVVAGHPGTVLTNSLLPWIGSNAVWRFLDNGTNAGTAWRAVSFDDSGWLSGPAPLGYGNGDEATVVSYGPDPNNKFITTYFRQQFALASPANVATVQVRLRRDDGIAVYVNGTEAFRNQLPIGAGHRTPATVVVDGAAEQQWLRWSLNPGYLVEDANLVAAEIHQSGPTTSDATFALAIDLALREVTVPLRVRTGAGANVLSWPRSHPGWALEFSRMVTGVAWQPVTTPPTVTATSYEVRVPRADAPRFFRLRRSVP